jgi:hypothetical protein
MATPFLHGSGDTHLCSVKIERRPTESGEFTESAGGEV